MSGSISSLAPLAVLEAPMGGQIGYRVFGTHGDWLVLIHGWCGNADHWNVIAPELARDHRVLAVSHPGFGGMLAPPPAGQAIRAMGAAIAHLLAHLGIDGATLIGHSMGGPIMTEVTIIAPDRVRALIGLDTLTDRDYYGRVPDEKIIKRHQEFAEDYAGRMRAMIDIIVHPSTNEAIRQAITDDMVASAPSTFALDVKDDLFAWNAEERWPLVTCPAVMLNSTWVATLAHPDAMPCFSSTAIIEYDSGHFPMIEAPVMIVEKLRTCLAMLVYP